MSLESEKPLRMQTNINSDPQNDKGYFREADNKCVKTPVVIQMEALECGAAALCMVLGYFGINVPLEQLRVECGVSSNGTNALNVVKIARKYGLEVKALRCEIPELKDKKFPAIIFWNFNHFVTLEGIHKNKVYINDPAYGRKTVSWEDFDEAFTGVVLTFEKSENTQKIKKEKTAIQVIIEHIKNIAQSKDTSKTMIFLGVFNFYLFLAGLITPCFQRFFTDQILVQRLTGQFKPLVLAMLLQMIILVLLNFIKFRFSMRFGINLAVRQSTSFIKKIFRLPMEFFTQRIPGEISQRIDMAENISEFLSSKAMSFFVEMFSIVFYLTIMFIYDRILTLTCLVSLSVNYGLYYAMKNSLNTNSIKLSQEQCKLGGQVMSGISMIETLKANGLENDFFDNWSGQQAKYSLEYQKSSKLSMIIETIPGFISNITRIMVLVVGAFKIINGSMTIGMLMAFQIISENFSTSISMVMNLLKNYHQINAEINRIDDVMNYPDAKRFFDDFNSPEEVEKRMSQFGEKLSGNVELKNISFGYVPLKPPFIKDFSLTLSPGKKISFVGATGCGKSTLGKIICSLYSVWDGEVLFDGKPVSEIPRKVYSNSIGCVDQDIFLFEGSVKDNLTMWDETISDEDIVRACKDACIHDVISERPSGYYSKVEEGGMNFSGGQRQRLEIARALCRNPSILVLDEATSALDAVTERKIEENLSKRGCACIIIAHRLSTIRDCDEIIVFHKGEVKERGTHRKLLKKNGWYKMLVAMN